MESKILRALAVLGVPGVALGVFYLLLKQFGFEFSKIGPVASAVIVIVFLFLVGGITFFALHLWSPKKIKPIDRNYSHTQNSNDNYQKKIPSIEMLKEMIYELSNTNRRLLIEMAKSPDGQYIGDLSLNESLNLTRGEIMYRGKDLESKGFINIQSLTDHCFRFSKSILVLVNNDIDYLKSILETYGGES